MDAPSVNTTMSRKWSQKEKKKYHDLYTFHKTCIHEEYTPSMESKFLEIVEKYINDDSDIAKAILENIQTILYQKARA